MSQRRVAPRRLSVRVAALAAASLLLGTSLVIAPHAAAAAAQAPLTDHSVQVTILSVSPSTPAPGTTPQPLTVELRLTNTTDQSFDKVTVEGDRGNPIDSQPALEQAIAHPQPPDAGWWAGSTQRTRW